jgi:hypothetical protein
MMLSEDKISHLSHIVLQEYIKQKLLGPVQDEAAIRREIKRTIVSELKIGEEIDEIVRKKLKSFAKKLIEGTPEWEVLYKKYFREEETKKGRSAG